MSVNIEDILSSLKAKLEKMDTEYMYIKDKCNKLKSLQAEHEKLSRAISDIENDEYMKLECDIKVGVIDVNLYGLTPKSKAKVKELLELELSVVEDYISDIKSKYEL